MKKLFLVILLCFLFIGCSPKRSNLTELEFWTLQLNDYAPFINSVIQEFESQNKGIKVKWVDIPFSEGEKRTLATILSQNTPDLVNLNPDFSAILAKKNALYFIPEKYFEDYNKEIVKMVKYNEEIYAIPWYVTSAITIYNKKYISKEIKTYEDLYRIAPDIKKNYSKFVIMPHLTDGDTFLKILSKYDIFTPNDLLSEKGEKIFSLFRNLYKENYIPKNSITQTHREALEQYMSEEVACIVTGSNFLNMIKENAPDVFKDSDVTEQLKGINLKNDVSLMNLVIPKKARNKELALKFALFLTNAQNQLEFSKLTGVLPTNAETLNNPYFSDYETTDLFSKARHISILQLNNIQSHQYTNKKDLIDILNDSIQNALLNSQTSLNSVTKEVYNKWMKL